MPMKLAALCLVFNLVLFSQTCPVTPVISSPFSAQGKLGSAFAYQIAMNGTITSYSATGLPPGTTINTTTGLISGTPTQTGTFTVTISATNQTGTGTASITIKIYPSGTSLFVPLPPCRVVDTRLANAPLGGPQLAGGIARTFPVAMSSCIPSPGFLIVAYSFNVTVVAPGSGFPGNVNPSGALGYLTIYPTGQAQPLVSTLNNYLGTVVVNAAIVPAGTNGSVNVYVSANTDAVIDINGYFIGQ